MFDVYHRTWWKKNPAWPDGREPGVGICQVNGDWLLNTTPFAGKDWVSYGWLDNWACQAAEAVAS